MDNKTILQEAFKSFEMLEEDTFRLDGSDSEAEEAKKFMDVSQAWDKLDVIDPEADTEEDLEDSYMGKVILDCKVCHSKIYKDPKDIIFGEDKEYVNEEEECPYCYSTDGFKIVGQVAPFKEDDDIDVEIEDKEEVEVEEGCGRKPRRLHKKKVKEDMDGEWQDFEVHVGFAGYIGVEEVYDITARNIDQAKDEALEEASRDLDIISVYDEDGEVLEEGCGRKPKKAVKEDKGSLKEFWGNTRSKAAQEFEDTVDEIEEYGSANLYDVIDMLLNRMSEERVYGLVDLVKDYYKDELSDEVEESLKEDKITGNDLSEFQKWVDYDMEKYHRISGNTMTKLKRAGLSVVKDQYGDYEVIADRKDEACKESVKESIENLDIETENERIHISAEEKEETGEEVIEPVTNEIKDEIETENDDIDIDFDEFDEESFDELGESYLKKVYENVNSFKTQKVEQKDNKLIIEGLIKFNSGKEKKTSFIFEAKDATKKGKVRFIGENLQLTKGKNAFTLKGNINEGKLITESFNYNYRAKNAEGKSTRIYGTVKRG